MRIRKAEPVYSNFSSSLESKWEFIPWESRVRAGSGSQEKCLWTLPFDQKFTKNIPATRSRSSVPRTVMGIQLGYLLSSACQLFLAKAHGLRASGSEPSETAKGTTPEEAETMAPLSSSSSWLCCKGVVSAAGFTGHKQQLASEIWQLQNCDQTQTFLFIGHLRYFATVVGSWLPCRPNAQRIAQFYGYPYLWWEKPRVWGIAIYIYIS